jgi:hypothetical protein
MAAGTAVREDLWLFSVKGAMRESTPPSCWLGNRIAPTSCARRATEEGADLAVENLNSALHFLKLCHVGKA